MFEATAKVIADSISAPNSVRLTTLQLKYPRFIHAEFMTHRVFSRNASSSRAIPVAKMLEQVRTNPAMPLHWGKNQPGMQANEECDALIDVPLELADAYGRFCGAGAFSVSQKTTRDIWWRFLGWVAAHGAEAYMKAGYHKQVANRRLEADQFIHVIVTATEWQNFFDLRDHPDAQPEIQALAKVMREAIEGSIPVRRYASPGHSDIQSWHLPYVHDDERELFALPVLIKASAARCARVSYTKHDGTDPDIREDIALYKRLIESKPMHASPIEHQAFPIPQQEFRGNLRGWKQYRKLVESGKNV